MMNTSNQDGINVCIPLDCGYTLTEVLNLLSKEFNTYVSCENVKSERSCLMLSIDLSDICIGYEVNSAGYIMYGKSKE